MLPRIVLLVLQIAVAWFGAAYIAEPIIRAIGAGRDYGSLVYAVVYALLVWIVGLGGSAVLKGLRSPSAGTLGFSLVLALAIAIVMLVPDLARAITGVISSQTVPVSSYPLIGALIGYLVKR